MTVRSGVLAALAVAAVAAALPGCASASPTTAPAPTLTAEAEPDLSNPAEYILGDWTCTVGDRETFTLSVDQSKIVYTAAADGETLAEGTAEYIIDSLNLLTAVFDDGAKWAVQFPTEIVGGATDQVVMSQGPRVIDLTTTWSSDSLTFDNPNLGGAGSCDRS